MADKRVTMIKPVVGKVKSPSYALPESDFVYGIESKLDKVSSESPPARTLNGEFSQSSFSS